MTRPPRSPQIIISIQVARCVAAMSVVIWHLSTYSDILRVKTLGVPGFLTFGYAGVDLFFVVSGYIISHITSAQPFRFAPFMGRRVVRIIPFYALFTLLFVGAAYVVGVRTDPAFVLLSLTAFPLEPLPALRPGWSLEHEFIFYLIAGLALKVAPRRVLPLALGALFVVGVELHVVLPELRGETIWDYHLFSPFHFNFMLGVLIHQNQERLTMFGSLRPLAFGMVLTCMTAGLLAGNGASHISTTPLGFEGLLRVVGYGMASALIVTGLVNAESWLRQRAHTLRGIILVGDASFALYLSHIIVLATLGRVYGSLDVGPWLFLPAMAVAIGASVGFAVAFFLWVERPFLRCAHRWIAEAAQHDG